MPGFAEAIGLDPSWPAKTPHDSEMDVSGLVRWARSYFDAGELLHFAKHRDDHAFYTGPVMQTIGLATELTLKTLLRGAGKSSTEVRKFSHNTYQAYYEARHQFDEVKFINLHLSNTVHLSMPEEVRKKLTLKGGTDIERRWRVYFDHLRILDTVYDRPFRTRYVTPGAIVLPEIEIILVGTKLLLAAMEERLDI